MGVKIAKMKHYVALCSMNDIVVSSDRMELTRKDVFHSWASVEAKSGSFFSKQGFDIQSQPDRQTHIICMRYRADIDITSSAWIFEERQISPPRLFKILSVTEMGSHDTMWKFSVRLTEQSEAVEKPVAKVTISKPLPKGVVL